ncbi:MAG: FmdB family zinc ribbon protein [Dehalococcoidia bacterium]
MPLYTFRCPQCEFVFEVSRRMSEAGKESSCPWDGQLCDRVYIPVALNRGSSTTQEAPSTPAPAASGWSHFGHSHGVGAGGHSHGAWAPPLPPRPSE